MDAKKAGDPIYLVGLTHDELGASQYYKMLGFTGNNVPKLDPVYGKAVMEKLSRAMSGGSVKACHDCSEGGMAVALAEMAFAGGLGMEIKFKGADLPKLQNILPEEKLLFSESNTRFIVEVGDENKFLKAMAGVPIWKLGLITKSRAFRVTDFKDKIIIDTTIDKLKAAWQSPFKGE